MNSIRQYLLLAGIILFSVLVLASVTWANYRFVIQDTGTNAFLPYYAGTRFFLLNSWSPYSEQTNREIENLASTDEDQSKGRHENFTSPLFSVLIYSPFALVDDPFIARALWMTLLEFSFVSIFGVGIRLSGWRPSWWMLGIVLLFIFTWYYNLRLLLQGDVMILCALFISLTLLGIYSRNDGLAGFMLAMATIEFRMVLLLFPLILIWAIIKKRWVLFFSPIASLSILIAISSLFISDWFVQYLRQLFAQSNFGLTPGRIITHWYPGVGKQLGSGLSIFLGTMLIWEFKEVFKLGERGFIWLCFLILVATNLIGFGISLDYYVILLLAVIPILSTWDTRWKGLGKVLNGVVLLLFSIGVWILSINGARKAIPPELNLGLVFLVPLVLLIGLFWVKRWALQSDPLLFETENVHNY